MGSVFFIHDINIYVKGIYVGRAKKALVSISDSSNEFLIEVSDVILVLCRKRFNLIGNLNSRCTLTYTLNKNKFSVNAINTTFETELNYKTEICHFAIQFRGKKIHFPKQIIKSAKIF